MKNIHAFDYDSKPTQPRTDADPEFEIDFATVALMLTGLSYGEAYKQAIQEFKEMRDELNAVILT